MPEHLPVIVPYDALTAWEMSGELPTDLEVIRQAVTQRDMHARFAERFTGLIEECQHAEHLRYPPPRSGRAEEVEHEESRMDSRFQG